MCCHHHNIISIICLYSCLVMKPRVSQKRAETCEEKTEKECYVLELDREEKTHTNILGENPIHMSVRVRVRFEPGSTEVKGQYCYATCYPVQIYINIMLFPVMSIGRPCLWNHTCANSRSTKPTCTITRQIAQYEHNLCKVFAGLSLM